MARARPDCGEVLASKRLLQQAFMSGGRQGLCTGLNDTPCPSRNAGPGQNAAAERPSTGATCLDK
ncbi:hypothetical protein EMIT0P201_11992 [Pseudomonas chlororaphis]